MCVGRGPGIRRPKKFNSLSRISDRSDPDQLVNKLSGVSLINNASRAAIICRPGQRDNETFHDHRRGGYQSHHGWPGSEKCHAGNKLPQQKTDKTIIWASKVSDFLEFIWPRLRRALLLFVTTELRESVTFNQGNYWLLWCYEGDEARDKQGERRTNWQLASPDDQAAWCGQMGQR